MRRPALLPIRSAFSLLELLIVIGIIALMMSLIVPAVGSFGRSTALVTGGNLVANLATFARQQAITRSTMTALVLLCEAEGAGEPGEDPHYRAVTVLEYTAGAGWSPLTAWENLPTGIIVDHPAASASSGGAEDASAAVPGGSFFQYSPARFPFLDGAHSGPRQENPPVRYHGRKIKRYATRLFMPGGGLKNPDEPAQLRLVEGFEQDGRVIYTKPNGSGGTANYYDLTLIGATGLIKIDRP